MKFKGHSFLFLLIILLHISLVAQTQQPFSSIQYPVTINGRLLMNGFAGGMNNPQLSAIDLDRDGIQDLFIFDRSGDARMCFLYKNDRYEYAPEYQYLFPEMAEWVIIRDYNKDGIEDIFASSYGQGPQGVEVYTGRLKNDKLEFVKRSFPGRPTTMLNIPAGNSTTHLPVDYIDYPDISDIDNDGDLDILSFGPNSGYLYWYRNMAVENNWSLDSLRFRLEDFCWGKFFESGISSEITLSEDPNECASFHPNRLETRHAGSTVLSWDLNGDGVKELLLGDVGNPVLVALMNSGTERDAFITDQVVGFPDYDVPVEMPIFLSSFAIDHDHDGDDDLFVSPNSLFSAENKNTIWRYDNVGSADIPDFRFVSDDFLSKEMIDLGLASSPAFVDHDQDGLLDIVVGTGGYYVPGGLYEARLFLFENNGSPNAPSFVLTDDDYLGLSKFSNSAQGSYFFTPTFGDLDDDGDLDVIVGDIYGKLFFGENIAGPGNAIRINEWIYNYMSISVRSYSTPYLFDLNGDDKLDLVIGARQGNNNSNDEACSNFYYFENQGTAQVPSFDPDPDALPNTRCLGNALFRTSTVSPYSSPVFIKTQGKLNLLAGNDEGKIRRFSDIEDNIYGDFSKISDDLGYIRTGSRLRIDVADIDNDGYFEVLTGNYRGGLEIFKSDIKTGEGTNTLFLDEREPTVVFPNPVRTGETVYFSGLPSDINQVTIEIWDILGRKVIETLYIQGSNWPLSLEAGQYIIKATCSGVPVGSMKLLVLPH